MNSRVTDSHDLVLLAIAAIRLFVQEQRILSPPSDLFETLAIARHPAGAFVSLKLDGTLRGCIGTVEPTKPTLAEEVIRNAIGAATRDPRFPPVTDGEIDRLAVSVDVLGSPEPVSDLSQLDHRRYGIIARQGEKHAVLLPDIDGINSTTEQIAAVKKKAGCTERDPIELSRFEITRFR